MKKIFYFIFIFIFNIYLFAHHIDLIEGDVEIIKPSGQKIKAIDEMQVDEKDIIVTSDNSFVNIVLDDKSEISIEENTKIKLEKYLEEKNKKHIEVKLDKGMIKCLVNKNEIIQKEFKLSTPVAVVGVRGTEFITNYNENEDGEIDVFTGEVEISNIEKPDEKHILQTGESLRITKLREFIREKITEFKKDRLEIFKLRREILKAQKKKIKLKLELLKIKSEGQNEESENKINQEINEIEKNQKDKIKELKELRKQIIKKKIKNKKEKIKNIFKKEE